MVSFNRRLASSSSPPPLQHRRTDSVTLATRRRSGRARRNAGKDSALILLHRLRSLWKPSGLVLLILALFLYFRIPSSPQSTPVSADPTEKQHTNPATPHHNPITEESWKEALILLEERTALLFHQWFVDDSRRLFDLPKGIPGTGIQSKEEADDLQAYLDCMSSSGQWVYGPDGSHLNYFPLPVHKQSPIFAACDKAYYKNNPANPTTNDRHWNVRNSLKWYWKHSPACDNLPRPKWMQHHNNVVIPAPASLSSRQSLCTYLRHKNILLIGDSPTHYLVHDLLLDWTSKRPLTCYGDLYCKEHAICPDEIVGNDATENEWEGDVRVYERLPDAPSSPHQKAKSPQYRQTENEHRTQTRGTVLRYRRADSMFMNSSPSHPRHQPGFIHPHTGVRDINMYSVADGRRSDVTILYKAPLPWPRPSRSGSSLNKRMRKLAATIESSGGGPAVMHTRLLEIAVMVTVDVWIPEVLESLRALKAPPASNNSLVIYRGGWTMQPFCGSPSLGSAHFNTSSIPTRSNGGLHVFRNPDRLRQGVVAELGESEKPDAPEDFRTTFFNLQTTLQNHIMRKFISPQLGIPYIDLETSTSAWKSGFVGSAAELDNSMPLQTKQLPTNIFKTSRDRPIDCMRMCLPSAGLSLETFLLGSLHAVFEWGWGGPDRNETWVGPAFVSAKDRHKLLATTSP